MQQHVPPSLVNHCPVFGEFRNKFRKRNALSVVLFLKWEMRENERNNNPGPSFSELVHHL